MQSGDHLSKYFSSNVVIGNSIYQPADQLNIFCKYLGQCFSNSLVKNSQIFATFMWWLFEYLNIWFEYLNSFHIYQVTIWVFAIFIWWLFEPIFLPASVWHQDKYQVTNQPGKSCQRTFLICLLWDDISTKSLEMNRNLNIYCNDIERL